MKRNLFILVLALQSAWLLGRVFVQERAFRVGVVVLIETRPVDPRDLLRGDYVILNYKISAIQTNLFTSHYKVKPVEKVIAEIQAIKAIWPRPFIKFADDNSFVHREHYKRLLRELAKENLRWFTEIDVCVAEDDERLARMRDSGCQQILIGLESPHRASLEGVELKHNWKVRQQICYREAIAKIPSNGITVNGCFILGLDADTPEVLDEVLQFVREFGLYEVQITFLTAFPGTPLYARLKQEGRIIRDHAWELCTLFDINITPTNMTVEQLQSGFLRLVKGLYCAEETQTRRRNFKRSLRTSPNFGRPGQRQEQLIAA